MCFAYKPDRSALSRLSDHGEEAANTLLLEGEIKPSSNGFYYPKNNVEVLRVGFEVRAMRWDLIPRNFLMPAKPATLEEAVKRKNSRAKNPATGRSWGFDAYNARLETVITRPAFREPWKKGNRCLMPVRAWRERPNMDGAPAEFTGREFEVHLKDTEPYFLAGLFDHFVAANGEGLDSCTVITGPSDEIPELQGIYHERTPIVLRAEAAEAWLDPALSPEAAYSLLKGVTSPALVVIEVQRLA